MFRLPSRCEQNLYAVLCHIGIYYNSVRLEYVTLAMFRIIEDTREH